MTTSEELEMLARALRLDHLNDKIDNIETQCDTIEEDTDDLKEFFRVGNLNNLISLFLVAMVCAFFPVVLYHFFRLNQ